MKLNWKRILIKAAFDSWTGVLVMIALWFLGFEIAASKKVLGATFMLVWAMKSANAYR